MSIDPIQIPGSTPADASWPDFPTRGLNIPVPSDFVSAEFLRADSYSVAKLPNNLAIVAVASQDADLLSQPPTTDEAEIACRESSRVFLLTTTLSSANASPILCATITGRHSETYCDNKTFSPLASVDVTVPSAVWADESYTHVWPVDGEFAGRPLAIESRPEANVWRLYCLSGDIHVTTDAQFNFVAYGSTTPSPQNVSATVPLPYITHNGLAIPASNPQVVANANVVPTPSHPTVYIVAQAPVDGAYQLFLYGQRLVEEGFGWKQLTFDGENRNPRAVVDSDGNLHVVWETNRCEVTTQLTATLSFGAFGDYGTGDANEAAIAALVRRHNPEILLALGDNNYPDGSSSTIDTNVGQFFADYIGNYNGAYGGGAAENKFFPALGNHDWGDAVPTTNYAEPFLDYFTLPGNERYYRFVRGPCEFFVLDSDLNEPDGTSSTSVQAQWLEAALADSTAQWKIVYFHHAPYSSGAVHGSTTRMRWPFDAWGADAVLAAHEHNYERLTVSGIPYFVVGSGGKGLSGFSTPLSGSQFRYSNNFGALFVNATPTTLSFNFYDITNTLLDTTTLTKALPSATVTKSYAGLMYGILGPSSTGLANEALISAADKQAQLVVDRAVLPRDADKDKQNLSFAYTDSLFDIDDPTPLTNIPSFVIATQGAVSATLNSEDNFEFTGNPSASRYAAWACLTQDENNNPFSAGFTQLHYQISFDLNLTSGSVTNRSEADVRSLYNTFVSGFTPRDDGAESNSNVYLKNANTYTISGIESYYDKMAPIAGAYKYPPICANGDTTAPPTHLRHFILGVVPEKVRFRAANTQTQAEFTASPPAGPGTYTQYVEEEYYTGNYKLALLFETSANLADKRLSYKRKHAVRLFGNAFRFGTSHNFKVAVSYYRLRDEQVKMRRDVDLVGGEEQDVRFGGNIIVAVDNVVQGGENFIPDFRDNYWTFDIGFGVPTVGEFRIANPVPYDAHKWHDLSLTMAFSNVAISPHSIVANPYITALAKADRDVSKILTFDSVFDGDASTSPTGAEAAALTVTDYALSLGAARSPFTLNQIPITFEGQNTAPSVTVDGCDKLHIAYQSNRDGRWEVYYSGTLDQANPFRFDTRITASESRSLSPSIAVDEKGRRLVVWHDDRNGPFQIYAARSLTEHVCDLCDPAAATVDRVVGAVDGDDPYDPYDPYYSGICEIAFDFTNTGSSGNYHFRLSFYRDEERNDYYKSVDSSQDIANWYVGGEQLGYKGAQVGAGETVTVRFDAAREDDLTGQVYYVTMESYDGSMFTALPHPAIFYCPPVQVSRCNLPCGYTNTTGITQTVHFTVTVYKDADLTQPVMSASSAADQTGWVSGSARFPSSGLSVPAGKTVSAFFDPDFLPAEMFGEQNAQTVHALLCGVKYWVKVQSVIGMVSSDIDAYALVCGCEDVDPAIWRKDTQSPEWLSSGQGSEDRRLTDTPRHALFPWAIGSNDGAFYIGWEDQRYSGADGTTVSPSIFWGMWDSQGDRFYCSGQGYYDRRLTTASGVFLKPRLLVNAFQQPSFFYQSSTTVSRRVVNSAPPLPSASRPFLGDSGVFKEDTLPLGDDDTACFSIRVAENEVRKYHVDSDTPVSLVNDCFVKLEVHGPPEPKAVRFKNYGDTKWSDWLQILPALPAYPPVDNANFPERGDGTLRNKFTSFLISEDSFIAPWVLSAGNGVKTVYAQVLTPRGVSPVFSQDIIASYDEMMYKVEFFSTSDYDVPLPVYNGYPVVSTTRLAAAGEATPRTISKDDVSTILDSTSDVSNIYVKITFDEPDVLSKKVALKTIDRFADLGPLTFDVVQQGTKRQSGLALTADGDVDANGVPFSGVYKGSFAVTKSDGYRTKDGLGVIVVHIPTPCFVTPTAAGDDCDNPTLQTPEDIRARQKTETDSRIISLERFRYRYNQDLLCSFTTNQCVDGNEPAVIDDISQPPAHTGPVSCVIDDWVAERAAEQGFMKDGDGLGVYLRESPVYKISLADERVTGVVLGNQTEIEGVVFMVPGNASVNVTATDSDVTYEMPAGTITLGATHGFYRYAPTTSHNGTSQKVFSIGSTQFTLATGDDTVPSAGSGSISDWPDEFTPVAVVSGQTTAISKSQLEGLTEGEEVIFRFVAVATGWGRACIKGAGCGVGCSSVPDVPVNLDAAVDAAYTIDLSWTAPLADFDGYEIERAVDNGEYTLFAIVSSEEYSITSGLTPNTDYCFRVRAFNACGYSEYSNVSCCRTGCLSPPKITGFTVDIVSDSRIDLSWDTQAGVDSWVVKRKLRNSGSSFVTISSVLPSNATSYSDTTVSRNTCYYYIVVASNSCGTRSSSTGVACTTCTLPTNVSSCTVTPLSGTSVRVDWTAVSGADDCYVDRSDDGGSIFASLATVTAPTTTYTDSGLMEGTEYCYRIRAHNICGVADPSPTGCEAALDCDSPGTTFSWSVARVSEPYHLLNAPNGTVWVRESGNNSLDLSDHRITRVKFGANSDLDDVLVLMHKDEHVVQLWDGTPGDSLHFILPQNCILFANTFGWYISGDTTTHNNTPLKLFTETGTSHATTLAAGTSLTEATGDINDFRMGGFYTVNFTDGITKEVLRDRGFLDSNDLFEFNFAHIVCGVGHLHNFTMTCDSGTPSTSSSSTCVALNDPSDLQVDVADTTITLTWTGNNAGGTEYIIERKEPDYDWEAIDVVTTTTYTDYVATANTYCYRVRARDCTSRQAVCDVTLYMRESPSGLSDDTNLHVRVSGEGLKASVVGDTVQLYATQNGPITVTLIDDSVSSTCYHHLAPEVNGTLVPWDSASAHIDDTRLHGNEPQSAQITLSSGDRLQIYLSNTGGVCEDGEHDDQAGRSLWTLGNCEDYGVVESGTTSEVCVESGCPATCDDCCDRYDVTLSGSDLYDGTYILTREGCTWNDGSEHNMLRKYNGNWILTIGGIDCQVQWYYPCTACPPTTGWILDVGNTDCTGAFSLSISTEACDHIGISSSSPPDDPCNFRAKAQGGNEGYSQNLDISSAFSSSTTVRFVITYDTYNVPDRIKIKNSSNVLLFDSGCIGTNGEKSGYFDCVIADSPLNIAVTANCAGTSNTGWYYRLHCLSVLCTPTEPLAPAGSLMTPISACTSDPNQLLWTAYQVTPTTCDCGVGFDPDSEGDLTYQGGCIWESSDDPVWELPYDGSTWTLTRGTSPVLWRGTRTATDPVGLYNRNGGIDPTATRTVTIPCQTCPDDCADCCNIIEVIVSNGGSGFNGVWKLAKYHNEEPFWSSAFTGGSRPGTASAGVNLTIKCDGFNWIMRTVNSGSANVHFVWLANLTACPPTTADAWELSVGSNSVSITMDCLDCLTDCTSCPSYSLTTVGFTSCTDFNGSFALVKSGCTWSATGAYGITASLTCTSGVYTLKLSASLTRYAIATKPADNACPPTGGWSFTTVGCGGDVGTGTLS
jgi:tartrate-resistant acid phosphatase type 5